MPIKYSLISGDKAAITFPATAAGTYTIASLDAGLYEVTTDTSQSSFTLGFEDTNGYRFTGVIRGGKGYVSIGSSVTKIVIPASMTYPVNINIRVTSYSLIAAPTSASSAFGSSAYTINYTFTSPSGATDILAYYTDGTNASFGTTASPKNAVTAVPAVTSSGLSRTALLVAKDANGVSGLATSVITTSNISSVLIFISGGTATTYSSGGINYLVNTFTGTGTLTVISTINIDYMVIAGGGGGGGGGTGSSWNGSGGNVGGGGGAGGLLTGTKTSVAAGTYAITVGGGGAHVTSTTTASRSYNGTASVFNTPVAVTAAGGGGGGVYGGVDNGAVGGASGGCGGGSGMSYGGGNFTGGSGTIGYAGGAGRQYNSVNGGGGGGGGMGAVGGPCLDASGGTASGGAAGAGGVGITNSLRTGSPIYYAGGGGGSSDNATVGRGAGGTGGGGTGIGNTAYGTNGAATNGTANTGGGGGSGSNNGDIYALGGSGIVVLRVVV